MSKFIYTSTKTFEEANLAVEDLINRGVAPKDITIVSNDDYSRSITPVGGVEVVSSESYKEDNSWWDSFLQFFAPDPVETDKPYGKYDDYQDVVRNGETLVLVDESYRAEDPNEGYHRAGYADNYDHERHVNDGLNGNQTIKLHEEQLNVRKEREEKGDVEISKHVTEETKTIEVPVEREELHISRRKVNETVDGQHDFEDDTIVVPLSEERVVVDKDTVVTGEVEINKTVKQDTKEVTDTVRKEVLDVDGDQDIVTDIDPDKY